MKTKFLTFLLGFQLVSSFVVHFQLKSKQGNLQPQTFLLSNSPRIIGDRRKFYNTRCYGSIDDNFGDFDDLNDEIVASLTIPQLKQQLRLRGLKVSGKKQELMDRLLTFSSVSLEEQQKNNAFLQDNRTTKANGAREASDTELLSEIESNKLLTTNKSKACQLAEERGKELVDVTAYLDDEDVGKSVKAADAKTETPVERNDNPESYNSPEVWGSEAKIIDDFENETPIVDALSRTIVEYRGSNRTQVQAYVVASRDALKPFLAGGANRTASDPVQRLREIQIKREVETKRPLRPGDDDGADEGDETGLYKDVLFRDYSDWGEYTATGAQLSAEEVQGVLFLSDVYGAFTDDTKVLAEKIAFECQPVVVMVPDLFRGNPWKEDPTTPGFNEHGEDYEEWRLNFSDVQVSVDIRAAAAVLKEQYGVSSVVVWGTCFGGGRALEIADSYLPGDQIHDVDGSIGPLAVEPAVVVAWYPTRYNVSGLFGKDKTTKSQYDDSIERSMAVMAVFAGEDKIPGATPKDAEILKDKLKVDPRVKDFMVKVFPGQHHGFAHRGLGRGQNEDSELNRFVDEEFGGAGQMTFDDSDAEVACLLSTAFMETYSRVFLPTTGPPVSLDDSSGQWATDLSMGEDWKGNKRDVRQEVERSESNFKEEPLGGTFIDQTDDLQRDQLADILRRMEPEDVPPDLKIKPEDELEEIYAKLLQSDPSFQLF